MIAPDFLRRAVGGVVVGLLAATVAVPAAAQPSRHAQTDRLVRAIDARAAAAAPLAERPLDGFAAEGARVVAWGRPGAIEKISVEGLGERGRETLDFHWQGASLVSAQRRRVDHGASIRELPKDRPPPEAAVEHERMTFSGGLPRTWRVDDRDRAVGGSAARRRAAELLGQARSFRRLMAAPGPRESNCSWSCVRERGEECFRYACR